MNIAIDGPAGAGKSTIARRVAEKLGYVYVDTGAMYRAMALHFIRQGIDAADERAVAAACEGLSVSITHVDGEQQVLLGGENVTAHLRTEEVGNMASATSVYGCVRQKLLSLQRELAAETDVIMDGRDIGTCVLPDAQVKIYLTASVETRARRRYDELRQKGMPCDMEAIKQDIVERDQRDTSREIAPLRRAEDAVLVDSSQMSIEEVTERIIELCGGIK